MIEARIPLVLEMMGDFSALCLLKNRLISLHLSFLTSKVEMILPTSYE